MIMVQSFSDLQTYCGSYNGGDCKDTYDLTGVNNVRCCRKNCPIVVPQKRKVTTLDGE